MSVGWGGRRKEKGQNVGFFRTLAVHSVSDFFYIFFLITLQAGFRSVELVQGWRHFSFLNLKLDVAATLVEDATEARQVASWLWRRWVLVKVNPTPLVWLDSWLFNGLLIVCLRVCVCVCVCDVDESLLRWILLPWFDWTADYLLGFL